MAEKDRISFDEIKELLEKSRKNIESTADLIVKMESVPIYSLPKKTWLFRSYLKAMIDCFVDDEDMELVLIAYALHPKYPIHKYPTVRHMRTQYALDHNIIQDEQSMEEMDDNRITSIDKKVRKCAKDPNLRFVGAIHKRLQDIDYQPLGILDTIKEKGSLLPYGLKLFNTLKYTGRYTTVRYGKQLIEMNLGPKYLYEDITNGENSTFYYAFSNPIEVQDEDDNARAIIFYEQKNKNNESDGIHFEPFLVSQPEDTQFVLIGDLQLDNQKITPIYDNMIDLPDRIKLFFYELDAIRFSEPELDELERLMCRIYNVPYIESTGDQ